MRLPASASWSRLPPMTRRKPSRSSLDPSSRHRARPPPSSRRTGCWRGAWRRGSSATILPSTIRPACLSRAPCQALSSISCSARWRRTSRHPSSWPCSSIRSRCSDGVRLRRVRRRRALERGAFRDIYVGQGLAGARAALEAARSEGKRGRLALTPEEHAAALRLVADLEAAFAPLTALSAGSLPHPASRLAEAHAAAAEALARDEDGSVVRPVAGRRRRSPVGAAGRADRRRTGPGHDGRRLSALLSKPPRRPGGAPARRAPPAPLHLGTARSAPPAARCGDPRQPQRRGVAAAAGGGSVAQPAHAREARAGAA